MLTRTEKTVTGSYYGTTNTKRDFPQYADLYMRGLLDLDRLISKTYSLDEINEAYAEMLTGGMARGDRDGRVSAGVGLPTVGHN